MLKNLLIILLVLSIATPVAAQFTIEGTIEYKRSRNLMRVIDELDDDDRQWIDKIKHTLPKHRESYFNLYFNQASSMYVPGREPDKPVTTWVGRHPADDNRVYTNFKTNTVTALKHVYEENFLVKDTMRKIEWKIMDEVRTIANFKCRKAVGKMCDSVYIVAFYTEDIMVSGGPEMFSRLPGMILEVAIPRLHTTWIATNINISTPDPKEFKIPKKGTESTQADMVATIYKAIKRWGEDYADKTVWWALL